MSGNIEKTPRNGRGEKSLLAVISQGEHTTYFLRVVSCEATDNAVLNKLMVISTALNSQVGVGILNFPSCVKLWPVLLAGEGSKLILEEEHLQFSERPPHCEVSPAVR